MMTRLILVRHAETTWPAGQLVGQADPPLSERGQQQAAELAEELGPRSLDTIVTSPLARARQTAAPIARACGLVPRVDDDLREIDLGDWQGRGSIDLIESEHSPYVRWLIDPRDCTPPGGEPLTAVAQRAIARVESLLHEFAGCKLLVVTHSVVARVIISHLLGADLGLVGRVKLKRASVTEFRRSERGTVLVGLGRNPSSRRPVTVS